MFNDYAMLKSVSSKSLRVLRFVEKNGKGGIMSVVFLFSVYSLTRRHAEESPTSLAARPTTFCRDDGGLICVVTASGSKVKDCQRCTN